MPSQEPIKFVLENERGVQITADLLPGAGADIHFAVGEPGRHAAVWKIKAKRKKSDVYLMIRHVGKYQKVSLHPTSEGSKWWFQWTSEHMDADPQDPKVDDREIDHWPKPPEAGDTGWSTGLAIWTRHQDVVPAPNDESLPADMLWIPRPPKGHATGIHVVIARPNNLAVEAKGGLPVAAFALADGQVVLLIETQDVVTDAVIHELERAVAGLNRAVSGDAEKVRMLTEEWGRMLVWGDGPEGERRAWDIALKRAESPSRPRRALQRVLGLCRRYLRLQ
jgi:hypothetical protein